MEKRIGTKVYYCILTGNVLKVVNDIKGYIKESNFDEDYEIYTELKERNKDTIGLLNFEYGEYSKLSKDSTGVRVNLETKKLEFSYEELPKAQKEPSEIEIMQQKISTLEEGLKSVLAGDMQSLAYILYPKDFLDLNINSNKDNTTSEL